MFELDKFPLPFQIALLVGAAVASGLIWIAGRKSNTGDRGDEQIITELQEKLLEARFGRMESDLQLVISASRLALMNEIHSAIGECTTQIASLRARVDRLADRVHHKDGHHESRSDNDR